MDEGVGVSRFMSCQDVTAQIPCGFQLMLCGLPVNLYGRHLANGICRAVETGQ